MRVKAKELVYTIRKKGDTIKKAIRYPAYWTSLDEAISDYRETFGIGWVDFFTEYHVALGLWNGEVFEQLTILELDIGGDEDAY